MGTCHRWWRCTLLERENGAHSLIHLVNASDHFGNSFYEPLPIHDVVVSLHLEREQRGVKALVGGQCSYEWHAGILTARLPRLGLFEALEIEYRILENG